MNSKISDLKKKVRGVVCVSVTPFDKFGKVDLDAVSDNAKFLANSGVSVIAPAGSTGEFSSLSVEEFRDVVRATVEGVSGRVPILAGSSHSGTDEAIRLARISQEEGADGLLIVPPYYLKPSWDGTLQHYKAIAENVEIGISIYNNPGFSKVNLLPKNLVQLVDEIPGIIGVKETSGDMAQYYETYMALRDKVPVLMGRETLAFFGLACGSVGYVSSMANFAPKLAVELYKAFESGNFQAAKELNEKLAPYNLLQSEMLQKYAFPAQIPFAKAAMEMLGMRAGLPRLPMTPLNAEMKEKLQQILRTWALL